MKTGNPLSKNGYYWKIENWDISEIFEIPGKCIKDVDYRENVTVQNNIFENISGIDNFGELQARSGKIGNSVSISVVALYK